MLRHIMVMQLFLCYSVANFVASKLDSELYKQKKV